MRKRDVEKSRGGCGSGRGVAGSEKGAGGGGRAGGQRALKTLKEDSFNFWNPSRFFLLFFSRFGLFCYACFLFVVVRFLLSLFCFSQSQDHLTQFWYWFPLLPLHPAPPSHPPTHMRGLQTGVCFFAGHLVHFSPLARKSNAPGRQPPVSLPTERGFFFFQLHLFVLLFPPPFFPLFLY